MQATDLHFIGGPVRFSSGAGSDHVLRRFGFGNFGSGSS